MKNSKRIRKSTRSGNQRRVASLAVLLVMIIALSGNVSAQWVQGSSNQYLYFQFPSGRVGIGTGTTPLELLQVNGGNLRVDGNQIFNGNLSQTGNISLFPIAGPAASLLKFFNPANTNFSSFAAGGQTIDINYTLPTTQPTANQILSATAISGAGPYNVTLGWSSISGIAGAGNAPFMPRWKNGAVNTLENSIVEDFTSLGGAAYVVVGPPPIIPPTQDPFEVQGNTRIGAVYPAPLVAAAANGNALTFSGVPQTFGPVPTVNGDNTDIIQFYRRNNAVDNTEFRLNIGDNAEGMPTALAGPPAFLSTTPDYFTIGATNGAYQQMFSFSTDGRESIGLNVANVNALDVGFNLVAGGGTPPDNAPTANVAIGQAYAGIKVAPVNGMIVQGLTGFGTFTPGNQVDIDLGTGISSTSGLRLSQFKTPLVTTANTNSVVLSVNNTGDVILCPAGGGSITGSGSAKYVPVWTSATNLSYDILYDDGTSKIGINTSSPSSNLSFGFNSGTSPSAKTIGVEQTTTSSANGTPLTMTAGAAVSVGTNLNGGDLTLSSGASQGTGSSNIYFQTAKAGTSGTGSNSPATRVAIAGDGKVGLGTTSPSKDLSFDGASNRTIWAERHSSSSGKDLTVQAGGGNSSSNKSGGNLYLAAGISTGNASSGGTVQIQTPSIGSSGASDNLPTSRVYVTPSGTVGINVASPGYTLDVDDVVGGAGDIHASRNLIANTTIYTSDERLKRNVITISNALSKVISLRGVEYNFRDDIPGKHLPKEHQVGVIAQELQQILPEAVTEMKDGYFGVQYHMMIPLLIEAVKAQQNEIASKDAQIADLSSRLTKLEAAVFALSSNAVSNKSTNTSGTTDEIIFYQNNPNPFSATTTISYHLPQTAAHSELLVMSASGAEMMRLPISGTGNGTIVLNADQLAAGQYFYTVVTDGIQAPSKTMTVVK